MKRIRKAKLFVFLRQHRHEVFDEAFRAANWRACIEKWSADSLRLLRRGFRWRWSCKPLWAFPMTRVSEATVMDRRWQLVLDWLDTEQAPFSKGTLVAFRKLLIEAQLDPWLIERTIEVATQSQAAGLTGLTCRPG